MPQFWLEDFLPQIFWLAVSFAILYFLMSRVALPRIADVIEQRQERIADDLDGAQALKEQAEKVLAEYESALSEARSKAQTIVADAAAEAAAAADARNNALSERLAEEAGAAAKRIEEAKQAAMEEVRSIATDVAGASAARLLGGEVAETQVKAAVDQAMERTG